MGAQPLAEAGSYTFGRFRKNDEELARLKLQATVAIGLEREAWANAGLRPGMDVLDLGCGPGFTSCELARAVGNGRVTGIDRSEELIAVARQAQASERVENVSFAVGDAYRLDLPDARFDFVYARFLFQHLSTPHRALETVLRVLKPGGILCVLDIDDSWTSFSPASEAFLRFIRKAGAGQRRKGGNRLIGSQLYGLLRGAGFRDATTRIYPLTTEDLGVRMFLGVAVLFRLEMLSRWRKVLAAPQLRRIRAAAKDPHAWGSLGLFVCTGAKP